MNIQQIDMTQILSTIIVILLPFGLKMLNTMWARAKETDVGNWLAQIGLEAATQRVYNRFGDEIKKAKAASGKLPDDLIDRLEDAWYTEIRLMANEKFGIDITRFYSGPVLDGLRELTVSKLKTLSREKRS